MVLVIDPADITKYDRDRAALEELLLFCIIVAGKTAKTQARKLHQFLTRDKLSLSPFELIRHYDEQCVLLDRIMEAGLGQYNKIIRAFMQVVELDVETCTVTDLECVYGIGPKTSRFFILHSRPNQNVAVLDTHILKWMREEMGIPTPKSTPTGRKYAELEKAFLAYCTGNDRNPAELDLEIWNRYSRGN